VSAIDVGANLGGAFDDDVEESQGDNCFVAGTLVVAGRRTADGAIERVLKPIEMMQGGDPVWSEDPKTGWRGWGVVKRTFTNETREVAYLTHRPLKQQGRSEGHRVGVGGGEGGEEDGEPPSEDPDPAEAQTIRCTVGHPWWSEDRQAYVGTATLREGELLLLEDGSLSAVVSLVVKSERAKTFNFEVAQGAHSYFVAARADQPAVLVHNTSPSIYAQAMAIFDQQHTFYRAVGAKELARIENTGMTALHVKAGGEHFISPSRAYVEGLMKKHPNLYQHLLEIRVESGAMREFMRLGARAPGAMRPEFSRLPLMGRGQTGAIHFKMERGALNIGFRKGSMPLLNRLIRSIRRIR